MRLLLRSVALAIALFHSTSRLSAQAPPSTDIYLAPLSRSTGALVAGTAINITQRPGYDNQPSFTPDSREILYTSTRDDGQADIYRYDMSTQTIARVTSTPESEYSPTVMPGGTRFSVIRVERDSTQRLWSFLLDGSDPKLVIESLKPVGYHAWLDTNRLAMFVLGQPNALVIGNLRSGQMDTVARNIGRSLALLPDGSGFSFAQIVDSVTTLRGMDPASHRSWDIVRLPRGVQDVAWMRDGLLLAASGSRLIAWRKGDAAWHDVADFAGQGVSDGSRLAVSPDEKWLALVAVPSPY